MAQAFADGSQVSIERLDSVAVIRFANPPLSLIGVRGASQLLAAFRTCLGDPGLRAVVLTGGMPGVFVRHADVASIARSGRAVSEGRISVEDFADNPFLDLVELLDESETPVIAAINGTCMGGGLEIALACTMRIAGCSVGAIGLPEVRIDLIPGAGGMTRLARLIGPHRARLHVLNGAVLDAAQAHADGIVDRLADDPLSEALAFARMIAGRHPAAIGAIMRDFRDGTTSRASGAQFAAVCARPDVLERLDRFIANRESLDLVD